ncbi:MAG: hypothetical protein V1825_00515 [Candidatus Falkowbacteria bacterium]|nr:hypothetical protein [Candidatus Parcubacteria bacterium]
MEKIKEVLLANDEHIQNVTLGAGLHFSQKINFIFDLHENLGGSVVPVDENENFVDEGYRFDGVCPLNLSELVPEDASVRLKDLAWMEVEEMEGSVRAHISKAISSKLSLDIGVDPAEGYWEEPPKNLLLTLFAELSHNRGMAELYSAVHPFSEFPFISFNMEEYEEKLRDDAEFHKECHDDETSYSDYGREEDVPTVERINKGINDGGELFDKEFKAIFSH